MPYKTISVREALGCVNDWDIAHDRSGPGKVGWYLPDIQRQYVWGSRYEANKFICLLFDSLLRGFPIGSFLLWKTTQPVAFRKFASHYRSEEYEPIEDEGA